MEDIKTDEIILEDGETINFRELKKIANSEIEKCVCKIIKEEEMKSGTGFFCNIPQKKLKVIITNNHVINEKNLNEDKKIKIEVEEKEKEINLELKRFKTTDKDIDFTLIEIREEDNINNFLEIDENIYTNDYKNKQIFSVQHPGGDELNYSHGKILGKKDGLLLNSVGTLGGSSGYPLILFNNLKVIGLHKGCVYDENENKINVGIPINLIIDTIYAINAIKCIYRIKKADEYKDIQIINNGYYDFHKNEFIKCNEEMENKIKIIINGKELINNNMRYIFKKEGEYKIYITERETITNMSHMFYSCKSLQ